MSPDADSLLAAYKRYLQLELNLSTNSIHAYMADAEKLFSYCQTRTLSPCQIDYSVLQHFVATLYDLGIAPRSVARIISGIRSFYRFLLVEEYVTVDPSELLELPKLGLHLPTVLTVEEIDAIMAALDPSKKEFLRDRAILEMLYSCGLRVSELCLLRLSQIHWEEQFLQIMGKGRKERLVPMSKASIEAIEAYLRDPYRVTPQRGNEDYLFLSRLGKPISRITVFVLIKRLAEVAGIGKEISPHTFRHSFATHLLEGGAHLEAIRMMLGHADLGTTAIYTHLDKQALRQEVLRCHPRNKLGNQAEGQG